ncbi:uncharacterized protein [Battus philenor]|uniref:uncharacterized protein n=1 Tax=Battus philenor TaxID=42288 RepID=UPI0035CFAE13
MSNLLVKAIFFLALLGCVSLAPCEEEVDISNGERLDNGQILHKGVIYEKGDYIKVNATKVTACSKLVIRKCCPFGYANVGRSCVNSTTYFDAPVWDDYKVLEGVFARDIFRFTIGKMNCTCNMVRVRVSQIGVLDWSDNWHLKSDGNLFVELTTSIPPWTVLTPDKYCIDTFLYTDENGDTQARLDALACFADEAPSNHFEVRSAS